MRHIKRREKEAMYPSDLSEAQWAMLKPHGVKP
jgi:hypothetical protein